MTLESEFYFIFFNATSLLIVSYFLLHHSVPLCASLSHSVPFYGVIWL